LELVEVARTLIASLNLVDDIERQAFKLRPRERQKGMATALRAEALAEARACRDRAQIQARHESIVAPLRSTERDNDRHVFRVALLGDVYSISEPFFNMDLEQKMGDLGLEVDRWLWLSDSLRFSVVDRVRRRSENHAREEEAGRYLGRDIGGFALPSVKSAVSFAKDGIDGLVHLAPFNCTPEIVAASVLPRFARDHDLPLLGLSFDEHTAEAGLVTRLEAFADLLERRYRRRGLGREIDAHWPASGVELLRVRTPVACVLRVIGSQNSSFPTDNSDHATSSYFTGCSRSVLPGQGLRRTFAVSDRTSRSRVCPQFAPPRTCGNTLRENRWSA
jgi:predicted nucleotide-binding protein (sugar kinase/HSP70/actin superfamily)